MTELYQNDSGQTFNQVTSLISLFNLTIRVVTLLCVKHFELVSIE